MTEIARQLVPRTRVLFPICFFFKFKKKKLFLIILFSIWLKFFAATFIQKMKTEARHTIRHGGIILVSHLLVTLTFGVAHILAQHYILQLQSRNTLQHLHLTITWQITALEYSNGDILQHLYLQTVTIYTLTSTRHNQSSPT